MAIFSRSVKSFILVVGFLILTAVAAVIYGGDEARKQNMQNSVFWQKTQSALSAVWALGTGLGNNNDVGTALKEKVATETPGFWADLKARFQTEWQKVDTSKLNSEDIKAAATASDKFLSWERNENGVTLIFRLKSGEEYKLNLPFKFLGR